MAFESPGGFFKLINAHDEGKIEITKTKNEKVRNKSIVYVEANFRCAPYQWMGFYL